MVQIKTFRAACQLELIAHLDLWRVEREHEPNECYRRPLASLPARRRPRFCECGRQNSRLAPRERRLQIEFTTGLAYIFFCLPFFALGLPLLTGVISLIASIYALSIPYPNRCELALEIVAAIAAFALFTTTSSEAICLRRSLRV